MKSLESLNVALVFSGQNALDQTDIRLGVLRIPEVTQTLREAQVIFDQCSLKVIDLRAFMISDDLEFRAQTKLKSLVSALVQIALFKRWSKFHAKPNYLIGNSNLDSALQYAAGRKSLDEIVRQSTYSADQKPGPVKSIGKSGSEHLAENLMSASSDSQSFPVLGGLGLVEYNISILDQFTQKYISIRNQERDVLRLFSFMADQLPIDQIVNIGPGCPLFSNYNKILFEKRIQVLDSIDLDPMLDWFWTSIKPADAVSQ